MGTTYCSICGRSFNDNFEIVNHYRTVHYQEYGDVADTKAIKDAKNKVKGAVIVGIISGIITGIAALAGIAEFGKWNLLDAALIFGLVFGIYKNNRACAIILFVYWIIDKLTQVFTEDVNFISLIVAVVISVYYWNGIRGTFECRRCLGEAKRKLSQVAKLGISISESDPVSGETDNKSHL